MTKTLHSKMNNLFSLQNFNVYSGSSPSNIHRLDLYLGSDRLRFQIRESPFLSIF